MKKVLMIAIALFTASLCIGQNDSLRVEQYCQLIDFGDEKSAWRDNRLRSFNGKLKKFNTIIDALNFMGRDDWKFISVFPVRTGSEEIYHFAFRKEFLVSAIQNNQ